MTEPKEFKKDIENWLSECTRTGHASVSHAAVVLNRIPLHSFRPWQKGVFTVMNTYCHAFLNDIEGSMARLWNYPGLPGNTDSSAINTFRKNSKTDENVLRLVQSSSEAVWALRTWHEYLMYHPVLGRAFKEKHNFLQSLRWGDEIDLDCPQWIAMTTIVASRVPRERWWQTRIWYKMVRAGADPDLAFVLVSGVVRVVIDGIEKYQFKAGRHGHDYMDLGSMSTQDCLNFRDQVLNPSKVLDYPISRGYHEVNAQWARSNLGSTVLAISENVPWEMKTEEVYDPFTGTTQKREKRKLLNADKMAKQLLKMCEELEA